MNGGPVEDQNQWEVQNRTGLCKGRCIIECYGFRKAMASWSCYVNVVSHGHGRASRMYDGMRIEVYNLWWSMLAMYSSQIHILCQDDLPRRSWLVRLRSSWESYTIYTCLFSSWEWGCRNVWTHQLGGVLENMNRKWICWGVENWNESQLMFSKQLMHRKWYWRDQHM